MMTVCSYSNPPSGIEDFHGWRKCRTMSWRHADTWLVAKNADEDIYRKTEGQMKMEIKEDILRHLYCGDELKLRI